MRVDREGGVEVAGWGGQSEYGVVWVFCLTSTWTIILSSPACYRQWDVRHASAGVIGRVMTWHQAHEWLIGLMHITVCKCFFIPLWLAMQQIFYL